MSECYFCNHIYDYDELMSVYHGDREINVCITHDETTNTYSIWQQCEDDFYTDNVTTIKYCPKCGRKLND